MKIGTVVTCFLPSTAYGGPVYSTMQRISELARRDHDVTVITSNVLDPKKNELTKAGIEELSNGITIHRFPSYCLVKHFSGIISFSLLDWLGKYSDEFDVFHISYAREFIPIAAVKVLQRNNAKTIIQTHGMLNRRDGIRGLIDQLSTSYQLSKADRVIVLQEQEEKLIERISSNSFRCIVSNGIYLDSNIPSWHGINYEVPIVLFLARLHPRKKVIDFIDAARILVSKNDRMHFRIVGPDGGDEAKARQKVQSYNLDSNISFIGPVSREAALKEYSKASIYVLPSINEPFATTITEALSIGVPTIVTDTTQNLSLLERWNAVEIVRPNAISLAKGIDNLLGNPELCNQRSINGKKLIQNELSITETINKLEKIYLDCLNG